MKKLVIFYAVMFVVLFTSCARKTNIHTYWMRLVDGSEITVQYELCYPSTDGIVCWTKYVTNSLPDSYYKAMEFHQIDK